VRKTQAILLGHVGLSAESERIAKILSFFGVPWRALTTTELLSFNPAGWESSLECKLIGSADNFLLLAEVLERDPGWMQFWQEQVHSAFIHAGNEPESLQKLAQRLIGDNSVVISDIDLGVGDLAVSDNLNDFCRVMSGIRVNANTANTGSNFVLNTADGGLTNIISLGDGAVFLKLEYKGVPVFLSTSREIIDIDAELTSQNFDVREHFLAAVPLVLYVKWTFAESCWNTPEVNACLVIDDPLLKPTHGFVDFEELLSLMKQHNFSTNIAFIPWNWRRSDPRVVQLFRENPKCYSLSVHGCDHTQAEFGSSNRQRLYWKAEQAADRMNRHKSMTGIHHDPVMVFPQGIFSAAAMSVLKHTDLIGAVNNDVVSADPSPRAITISDVWDIAIMRYPFPLFTRRYPWEGIENFAFDALLGKPAISVIHHDYCSDRGARLLNYVQQVNALQCAPTWRNLGDVVRRSYRQRLDSTGAIEVEMYGTELRIENLSGQRKRFLIRRRECDPSAIERICTDAQEIAWRQVDGRINFEIDLNPSESRVMKIKFHGLVGKERSGDNLPYRFKAMLRRYLCEIRDNYVVPMRCRFAGSR
jgi:hypothetical protein